jgi:hypothetical protein
MCCQEKQEKSTETFMSNEQRTKTKHSLSFFVGEINVDKYFFVPRKVRVKISFYYRRHYKKNRRNQFLIYFSLVLFTPFQHPRVYQRQTKKRIVKTNDVGELKLNILQNT